MKTALSIQSHVVHGYVGGRSAIFPLQTLGWDVDSINTVNFSNHTGYGSVKGTKLKPTEIEDLLKGIFDIGVQYQAVISGYIPNSDLIATVGKYLANLKESSSNDIIYLLDPVMGDQGYLYVDESCVLEYKNLLASNLVDIVTPNQFELELLCETKINNLSDLKYAINFVHEKYNVKYVVVTSVVNLENLDDTYIYCAFSAGDGNVGMYQVPIIKSYFTGVGDLFSALLLDKLYCLIGDGTSGFSGQQALKRAVNQVLSIITKTLKLTHTLGQKAYHEATMKTGGSNAGVVSGKINDGETMKYFELKIIQARDFYSYSGEGEYKGFDIDSII